MDVTQALKDTENALRDFIALILSRALGPDWIANCGVSAERLQKWENRKNEDVRKQNTGVVEERLIYYADFYDIKTILKKHWQHFSAALGNWKTIEVYLSELEKLQNPDAHRRELLIHQKHLALGIAGEVRSRLVRYRSKQETSEDYYPRIESIHDNLGNQWVPGSPSSVNTGMALRPGDTLEFVVTARDPNGDDLEYRLDLTPIIIVSDGDIWQDSNEFFLRLTEEHVAKIFRVHLYVRSRSGFHAHHNYDDLVTFFYEVLPPKG